jgi:hypothetical protein
LLNSKEATARSRFFWARCRSIFVTGESMRRARNSQSTTAIGIANVFFRFPASVQGLQLESDPNAE